MTEGKKIIAIPVCWMLYECPSELFAILGASVSTPSGVVLEAMVEQGFARRITLISTESHHEDDDTEETREEGTSGETPWFPGTESA